MVHGGQRFGRRVAPRAGVVVVAMLLGVAVSGCASGPPAESMARAIVIANPSSEALAGGDWRRLGQPSAAQAQAMARLGISARGYQAGLARLERDAVYREQVAKAMLAEMTRPTAQPPLSGPGASPPGPAAPPRPAAR